MLNWARAMEKLAAMPNVTCKVSGLLTELTSSGTRDDVARAAGVLFDLFGADRLVWGSDWPVLTLAFKGTNGFKGAGAYQDWFAMAREAIAAKQESAVPAVMGANALRLYRPETRHIHA
jgi:L-fuconolactonase